MHFLKRLSVLIGICAPGISLADPIAIPWSSNYFGPDGPWQAVEITIGKSNVSLYPGGSFAGYALSTAFCSTHEGDCPAAGSGLYDRNASDTADDYTKLSTGGVIEEWGSDISLNLTATGSLLYDTFSFTSVNGGEEIKIPDVIFWSVTSQFIHTPTGFQYPTRLGALALGAPVKKWVIHANDTGNATGSLVAGYLKANDSVPSNSWGIHIGSALYNLSGSLVVGGYDQSRAIGDFATFPTTSTDGQAVLPLVDLIFGVENGNSPFDEISPNVFDSAGNASVQVILNPATPYLSLPPGICSKMASHLPVTFKPSLGLYTWNTDDPAYDRITTSAAQMEFIFQESPTKNLTVKLPFALLRLQLEDPLANPPVPYFPCSPFESPNGIWSLGRAFLQTAYLGVNWDNNMFFIAQAPGPGANTTKMQVQSWSETDTTMKTDPIASYAATWQSTWKQIDANTTSNSSNSSISSGSTPSPTPASNSLSGGAIAGIVVGCVVAVAALALLGLFLLRKRRGEAQTPQQRIAEIDGASHPKQGQAEKKVAEMDNAEHRPMPPPKPDPPYQPPAAYQQPLHQEPQHQPPVEVGTGKYADAQIPELAGNGQRIQEAP